MVFPFLPPTPPALIATAPVESPLPIAPSPSSSKSPQSLPSKTPKVAQPLLPPSQEQSFKSPINGHFNGQPLEPGKLQPEQPSEPSQSSDPSQEPTSQWQIRGKAADLGVPLAIGIGKPAPSAPETHSPRELLPAPRFPEVNAPNPQVSADAILLPHTFFPQNPLSHAPASPGAAPTSNPNQAPKSLHTASNSSPQPSKSSQLPSHTPVKNSTQPRRSPQSAASQTHTQDLTQPNPQSQSNPPSTQPNPQASSHSPRSWYPSPHLLGQTNEDSKPLTSTPAYPRPSKRHPQSQTNQSQTNQSRTNQSRSKQSQTVADVIGTLLEPSLAILPAIANPTPPPADLPPPAYPALPPTRPLKEFITQDPPTPGTGEPPISDDLQQLQLRSDRQEFDQLRGIATATGNVVMTFRGAVLQADSLEVDLNTQLATASGNVTLTRGEQILEGDRFKYSFGLESGTVFQASGEVFIPTASQDFSPNPASKPPLIPTPLENFGDRLTAGQPRVTEAVSTSVELGTGDQDPVANQGGVGQTVQSGSAVNRLRFSAKQIDFTADGWIASNVRITNDPFTPAELELRTQEARLVRLPSGKQAVQLRRPRLVFDDGFSLPLLRNQVIIDRQDRDSGLPQPRFDDDERGGFYLERRLDLISTDRVTWDLTPQFLLQRLLGEEAGSPFDPDAYGLLSRLRVELGPRTGLTSSISLSSLDLGDLDDELRASTRLRQLIGSHPRGPNTLTLEASYRDRLFNGSLGFQTVQTSLGAVFVSRPYVLGKSGIVANYQIGLQQVNAESDQAEFLDPGQSRELTTLTRYQTSLNLGRGFVLWKGKELPSTPDAGLRYSPVPIVPFLRLELGVQGIGSLYSNGDDQGALIGTAILQGQIGHFSKRFLDYTGFRIGYSQAIRGEESPFLFDRIADTKVLFGGIQQQIYGPVQIGVQFAVNLDNNEAISTSYSLQYSRRTYSVGLRYDPTLGLGGILFRINGFNWTRGSGAFAGIEVLPVEGGQPNPAPP